jgi:hypothetical protein
MDHHGIKVTTKNVEPPPPAVSSPARAPALHFHVKRKIVYLQIIMRFSDGLRLPQNDKFRDIGQRLIDLFNAPLH